MEIAKALESEEVVHDHAGASASETPCKGSEALFGAGSDVLDGEKSEEPNVEGSENTEKPQVEVLNSGAENAKEGTEVNEGEGKEATPSEVAPSATAAGDDLDGSPDEVFHPCNVCSGKGQAFVEQDGIWLCLICVSQLQTKTD